jgi:hypothetical protein
MSSPPRNRRWCFHALRALHSIHHRYQCSYSLLTQAQVQLNSANQFFPSHQRPLAPAPAPAQVHPCLVLFHRSIPQVSRTQVQTMFRSVLCLRQVPNSRTPTPSTVHRHQQVTSLATACMVVRLAMAAWLQYNQSHATSTIMPRLI